MHRLLLRLRTATLSKPPLLMFRLEKGKDHLRVSICEQGFLNTLKTWASVCELSKHACGLGCMKTGGFCKGRRALSPGFSWLLPCV